MARAKYNKGSELSPSVPPASATFSDNSDSYTVNGANSVTGPATINGGALNVSAGTMQVASGAGVVNPVQIETLPSLDRMVVRGNVTDVATVEEFIRRVEMSKSKDGEGPNDGHARMGLAGDLRSATSSALTAPTRRTVKQYGTGQTSLIDGKGKAVPQKPLETWKPAHVVPNASRLMVGEKEELPLKGMQVDVRVDGFRARVLLDLYYFNDRPQQLEGNFQLRLPDEAAPYFFAFGKTVYQAPQVTASDSMFFKPHDVLRGDTTPEKILALRGNSWEQPKVARMVPKEKAAMAYRDTVRRRIDPALVEWSGAGVFQCRVFPLALQSLHRITIGYDVDLVRVGDDLELRLDLPEWQSGDVAPATVVDLNVAAADARQVSLGQGSETGSQRPEVRDQRSEAGVQVGNGRIAYRLVDPKDRPLMVRLRKPGTLMLAGNDDATGGYFATRVTLPLPESERGSNTALTPGPSPSGRGETARSSKTSGLSGRYVAERRAAVQSVDEDAAGDAGQQPRPDQAIRRALLQRRDVLVAGEVC